MNWSQNHGFAEWWSTYGKDEIKHPRNFSRVVWRAAMAEAQRLVREQQPAAPEVKVIVPEPIPHPDPAPASFFGEHIHPAIMTEEESALAESGTCIKCSHKLEDTPAAGIRGCPRCKTTYVLGYALGWSGDVAWFRGDIPTDPKGQ